MHHIYVYKCFFFFSSNTITHKYYIKMVFFPLLRLLLVLRTRECFPLKAKRGRKSSDKCCMLTAPECLMANTSPGTFCNRLNTKKMRGKRRPLFTQSESSFHTLHTLVAGAEVSRHVGSARRQREDLFVREGDYARRSTGASSVHQADDVG